MRLFWGCLVFSLLMHLLFFPGFLSALMGPGEPSHPPQVTREKLKVRLVERKAPPPKAAPRREPTPEPQRRPRPAPQPPLARHDHPIQTRPSQRPPVESAARTETPPRTAAPSPPVSQPAPKPPALPRYPTAEAPRADRPPAPPKPSAPAPAPRLTRTAPAAPERRVPQAPGAERAQGPSVRPGTVPVTTAVDPNATTYEGVGQQAAGETATAATPSAEAEASSGLVGGDGSGAGPGPGEVQARVPAPAPATPPPAPKPPPPPEPPARVASAPPAPRVREAAVAVPVLRLPARLRRESFKGSLSLRAVIEADGSAAYHLSDSSGNSEVDQYILEQVRQVAQVTVALDEAGQPKRAVKRVRVVVEVD